MEIQETTFGPKQYLAVKKTIATSQITDTAMYEKAFKKLGRYPDQNKPSLSGRPAVLYFMLDEGNKKAEIGIAVPARVTG